MRILFRETAKNTKLDFQAKGKWSVIASESSVRSLLLSGMVFAKSKDENDVPALRAALSEVSKIYCDKSKREKYKSGYWNVVKEIKRFPVIVWENERIIFESTMRSMQQLVAEKNAERGILKMGWPISNGPASNEYDFYEMPSYKRCTALAVF